mgnify:CR=1 FL=1
MVKSFVLMLDLHFDDLVRQLVEVLAIARLVAHKGGHDRGVRVERLPRRVGRAREVLERDPHAVQPAEVDAPPLLQQPQQLHPPSKMPLLRLTMAGSTVHPTTAANSW